MTTSSSCFLFCWIAGISMLLSNESSIAQRITYGQVQEKLQQLDKDITFRSVSWGCEVMKAVDGKVVASINPDRTIIPASTLKLAITYPVWKLSGPDYCFETSLEYDGDIKDSVLHGNIFIKGGGDPTLGSWRFPYTTADSVFERFHRFLISHGIKEIEGGVIADADFFDDQLIPGSWSWEDMGNYYGSGVSGLNFHENSMEIVFQPGKTQGDPATVISIDPPIKDLIYENKVITGPVSSGDQVIIYGAPFDAHRVFEGSVPAGENEFIVRGSLPDPAILLARQFHNHLSIKNIHIHHEATTVAILRKQGIRISQDRKLLGKIFSPPLAEIVRLTHEKSINLYADCLLKLLGRTTSGTGSYVSGIQAVYQYWEKKGAPVSSLLLKDGSGLSVSNRISPHLLAVMVRIILLDKEAGGFWQTLNLAGETGDMKSMFPTGRCLKSLRAKSGYMKNVRAYAGSMTDASGQQLSFSIIVNHPGQDSGIIKQKIKELLELLCRAGE